MAARPIGAGHQLKDASITDRPREEFRTVLALGAGGMLGDAFLELFGRLGVTVHATDLSPRGAIGDLDGMRPWREALGDYVPLYRAAMTGPGDA